MLQLPFLVAGEERNAAGRSAPRLFKPNSHLAIAQLEAAIVCPSSHDFGKCAPRAFSKQSGYLTPHRINQIPSADAADRKPYKNGPVFVMNELRRARI
jgi:hypothetical protein